MWPLHQMRAIRLWSHAPHTFALFHPDTKSAPMPAREGVAGGRGMSLSTSPKAARTPVLEQHHDEVLLLPCTCNGAVALQRRKCSLCAFVCTKAGAKCAPAARCSCVLPYLREYQRHPMHKLSGPGSLEAELFANRLFVKTAFLAALTPRAPPVWLAKFWVKLHPDTCAQAAAEGA